MLRSLNLANIVSENRAAVVLAGWIGIFAVALVDYLTGTDIGFSIFYLAPLFVIAFAASQVTAMFAALSAAALWLAADYFSNTDLRWHLFWNSAVRLAFFTLFVGLFLKLRLMLEAEKNLARIDPLTLLPNSRALFETASAEFARCSRHGRPVAIAYIDCDGFKAINDTFGHDVGDEVLRVVAKNLRHSLRSSDILARVGGDEFCAVLPEAGSEAAEAVANKLVASLQSAMAEQGWPVTVSVGLAVYLAPPDPVRQVINAADELMYSAKAAGKNRYHVKVYRQ